MSFVLNDSAQYVSLNYSIQHSLLVGRLQFNDTLIQTISAKVCVKVEINTTGPIHLSENCCCYVTLTKEIYFQKSRQTTTSHNNFFPTKNTTWLTCAPMNNIDQN